MLNKLIIVVIPKGQILLHSVLRYIEYDYCRETPEGVQEIFLPSVYVPCETTVIRGRLHISLKKRLGVKRHKLNVKPQS